MIERKWMNNGKKINKNIEKTEAGYVRPAIPFIDSALIKDFNNLYAKVYDKEKFIQA